MHRLERTQLIPRSCDEVFPFFADASNLEAITPPFLRFRILTPTPIEMRAGARIDFALKLFGVPVRWRTCSVEPGVRFVDEQESGPYAFWRHVHEFEARGGSTMMRDTVEYAEPLGPLGRLAHALFVERTLDRIFDFRRDTIRRLFESNASSPARLAFESGQVSSPGKHDRLRHEVFYDGDCPLCMREIRLLRQLDKRQRIRFVDIAVEGFDAASVGVSSEELMDRLHGRLPDGTLIEGVEVFRRLYAAVGFAPLVTLTRLPGIEHALDLGYGWFAKNRLRLTGRCADGACTVDSKRSKA